MSATSEIELSPIIFGAMGLPNLSAAVRTGLIHCAIDHGITSFDTAPLYGAGESERILGKALAGRRARVQLLTKCGLRWDSDHGQPMFEMPVDGRLRMVRKDSRPAGIRARLEASLRDLDTDVIDVYQVHQYDDATPIEDVIGELERALTAGKIRAIGVSNYPIPELRRAQRSLAHLFSTQSPTASAFRKRRPMCWSRRTRTGLHSWRTSPWHEGVLAGKYLERPPENTGRTLRGLKQVNGAQSHAAAGRARAQPYLGSTRPRLGVGATRSHCGDRRRQLRANKSPKTPQRHTCGSSRRSWHDQRSAFGTCARWRSAAPLRIDCAAARGA